MRRSLSLLVSVLFCGWLGAYRLGPVASAQTGPRPEEVGQWDAPVNLPVVAIHSLLLPTGKVLAFSFPGSLTDPQAYVCDPKPPTCTPVPVERPLFCSGHAMMADGRAIITGGRAPGPIGGRGIPDTHVFDPFTETWSRLEDMSAGRWYPTSVALADGRVLTAAGNDETGEPNTSIEVYEVGSSTGWRIVAGDLRMPVYPWAHVLSSGDVFYSGPSRATAILSTETWTVYGVTTSNYGDRSGGMSVLLPGPPDRVMIIGGANAGVVTPTAEIIDLAGASPGSPPAAWRYTQPMTYPRMHANAVVLPDGKVLVIGGHSDMHGHDEQGDGTPPPSSVLEAELFDPATETWSLMASMQVPRVYHSTALLLPDARVVAAGSTGIGPSGHTAEIYSPPYLFRGPRPSITAAPERVSYGESFQIETPEAAGIEAVVMIRLASVTHSVNTDQRYVRVAFKKPADAPGVLVAEAPPDPGLAPPGYYMLFVLAAGDVPSGAKTVQLGTDYPAGCGSGVIGAGEECDDGNRIGGDGCDADCQVETCYACTGEPSACTCAEGSSCGTICGEDLVCRQAGGTCQCVQ